ncbi:MULTISPECIES: hypothetical protein [Pectobacterium]|uniref:hypothetical protein n=1 Tax=Pectobacterium TaxID=122277 RepID=UPI000CD245BE|nr:MULTISPECIES: hypothetical protein [Pectobacterium]MCO4313036.1 hypothetical protein [Pectobacterium versatile]POD93961.1 hypothetical protein BV925_05455 [Pectobacterium odoriferum]
MEIWQIIIIPILTVVLGGWLTYLLGRLSKRDESARRYKEEQYLKLLLNLPGFLEKTRNPRQVTVFMEESIKAWLYSSDGVVRAINALKEFEVNGRQHSNPQAIIDNIALEMRKDLIGRTKLKGDSLKVIHVDHCSNVASPSSREEL